MEKSIQTITKQEIDYWYRDKVTKAFIDLLAEERNSIASDIVSKNYNFEKYNHARGQLSAATNLYDALKNKKVFI